jgi:CBS domain-containing protein
MRVADLMHLDLVTIRPDATVAEAATTLAHHRLSALPVVDADGRLVGVFSTSDLVKAEVERDEAASRAALFEGTLVQQLMTPRPYTIGPEADVREAARQMYYAGVRRVFVTTEDRPLGVVSATDIVRGVATGRC